MDWVPEFQFPQNSGRSFDLYRVNLEGKSVILKLYTDLLKPQYKIAKLEAKLLKNIDNLRVVKLIRYIKKRTIIKKERKFNIEIFMEDLGDTTLSSYILNYQLNLSFLKTEFRELIILFASLQRKRISHSDIRPENFMIHDGRLVLIDFSKGQTIGSDGQVLFRGDDEYLSPERRKIKDLQGVAEFDEFKSDVWSLGLVFWILIQPHHSPIIYDDNLQDMIYQDINIPDVWATQILRQMLVVDKNNRKDFISLESFMRTFCFNCGDNQSIGPDFLCQSCRVVLNK